MEPRLKTSTKWTPFPEELTEQIREVLVEHLADYQGSERGYIVEGRIYPQEITLRVGLNPEKGTLRQDNFEASLEYDGTQQKTIELIHSMVDFLAETWTMYFEDAPEREDLPRQWSPHVFEKKSIFLRYSAENSTLELEADKLLSIYDKKLVYGEDQETEEDVASENSLH